MSPITRTSSPGIASFTAKLQEEVDETVCALAAQHTLSGVVETLGEEVLQGEDPDALVIAEGGAAATAYSRLQFEELAEDARIRINEGLLRYCELGTLAMVMIVEGWRDMLHAGTLIEPS